MPLLDHFAPPLAERRHWHAFHNAWATYLSSDLNQRLPEGYFAEANVQFGIEIDVAAFEDAGTGCAGATRPSRGSSSPGGPAAWVLPAPTLTVPIPVLTDVVEVLVFDREGGPTLAAAVELVSPANKDRPAHRDAFVSKCATYLQQGVGLLIVDVVTGRKANIHDDLLARLRVSAAMLWDINLYAAAYRPVRRNGDTSLDIWQEPLSVGRRLPTLPLWLRGGVCVPVDLEATYDRTCREQRIG